MTETAEALLEQAREQGVSLVGPGGLLAGLTKTVLETALEAEITEHLGHERHGAAESGKVRNGTRSKMAEWANRPLDRVYPVVFIDAIFRLGPRRAGAQQALLHRPGCHGER